MPPSGSRSTWRPSRRWPWFAWWSTSSRRDRRDTWGRTADDELIQLAEVGGDTDMFDVLEVEIGEPIAMVAIRVETVESPSWVAWREIEIVTG